MSRLKTLLIRWLGGEKKIYLDRTRTIYRSHGRPFEMSDWERLASMDAWGQEFFRFLEWELKALDQEEAALPISADRDRDRLVLDVRRKCLKDLANLPDRALRRVMEAMTEMQAIEKKKGLSNHGR